MPQYDMLTIADLAQPDRGLAEDLVRVLMADEPTGEEPLMGIFEYALEALITNRIVPVLVPGEEPRWVVADDFESTARKLLAYFERQNQALPEVADGRNAANEWVRIMRGGTADPADLAALKGLIERRADESGTAWIELRLAFEQWLGSLSI